VDNSESRRRTTNLIWHLSDTRTLPEISVVGGFSFLNKKIIDFHSWYQQGFLKIITKSQISNSIVTIIGDIIILIAYSFVFVTLMLKKITVGIATFQLNAIDNFSGALSNLIGSFSMFSDIAPKMTDLIKLMHLKPAIIDGTTHLPSLQEAPALEFKNVWFKYPNADTYVLKDLDLAIRSKEKIAIVGENGAGKTTIIKLIARLYSIQKGKILINSNNLNDLAINDWYKNISVLFQDFNTYISLSAEENIAMGRPILGIDHDKVIAAAKQADAHKFISQYKHGYEQLLSERYKGGIRPSTGQWQKIALARMFYRDPPLLIFDEPTATIDAISEYRIFNRIYKFFKNKTVIIVSHRFSTVRNADRIIVLSKGRITEQGSHSELMEKNGTYAKMFRLQAKGYQ
jgi:ATP-binding cassette subfamily B protein